MWHWFNPLWWFSSPATAKKEIKLQYIRYQAEVQCVVTVSADYKVDQIDVLVTPEHYLDVLLRLPGGQTEVILAKQELPSIWQYGYRYHPGHSYDSRLVLNNSVIFTFNQVK